MRLVCFGDSITFGQHLPAGEKPWPLLLHNTEAAGRGVCNETTRQALERFPRDVQETRPDTVIIQFGLNDCNRWPSDRGLNRVSLPAFQANLAEMVQRARRFHITPLLCTLTPTLKGDVFERDAERYNTAVHTVAAATQAQVIDVRPVFKGEPLEALLLDDGVHLSVAGHHLYARTVQAAL